MLCTPEPRWEGWAATGALPATVMRVSAAGHLRSTGLDPRRVVALLDRVRREVDDGILPSAQLALARHGEVLAFEAVGDATTDTRYVVFSCIKPFVASAVWVLIGEGRVAPTARVAEYVPEFATRGKEQVTLEQVMLHTSGFPRAYLGPPDWHTTAGRLEAFRRWDLAWGPGTRYEYHPASAHWVLAEVIDRVTGTDFRDFLQERVTGPAGIADRVLGIAPEDQVGIAHLEVRGEGASPDELEAVIGIRELPDTTITHQTLVYFNEVEARTVGVPGGGGVMRADDLALFYQALLHDPARTWVPEVLADATGTVRNHLPDPLFAVPANRTLGLVQAGDDGLSFLRGFGTGVSSRAFGHGGAGGQLAWADPDTGLSFAFATNGIDANVIRQARRGIDLSTLAAACAA